MVFNPRSTIAARTASCPSDVHLHNAFTLGVGSYSEPNANDSNFSTLQVQLPHDAEALVRARTSSTLVSFNSAIAVRMRPLETPLQPQISAVSGRFSTLDSPSVSGPKISASRMPEISVPLRIRSKYQA